MLVSYYFAMTLPRSLSNSNIQKSQMQVQTLDDKITRFLNNKFRISRSYATKRTYESSLKQFEKFLKTSFDLNLIQLLQKIKASKELDSIEVLDEYYTFLSQYKRPGKDRPGYSVLLSIQGTIPPNSKYGYVTVKNINDINSYLQNRREVFSEKEVKRLTDRIGGAVTK